MEQEKNNQILKPGAEIPNAQKTDVIPTLSSTESPLANDLLFYNVMPQKKQTGSVIDPTMHVADNIEHSTEHKNVFLEYKKYFIIFIILLVIGIGGYFIVMKTIFKPYVAENILTTKTQNTNKEVKPNNIPAEKSTSTITTSAEWQLSHFGSPACKTFSICGDQADPDRDGLTNLEEFNLSKIQSSTDPNNADSDNDGLADGDEVHVFLTSPTDAHTAKNPKYSDSDFLKGGFSIISGKKMSDDEISEISAKMNKFGLHQPTLTTLKNALGSIYKFSLTPEQQNQANTQSSTTIVSTINVDQSAAAKQDRDAQRTNTMKNVGIALIKYYDDKKKFPTTTSFVDMVNALKPYNRVATNSADPINKENFVYTYAPNSQATDFTLSFYSETQSQLIKQNYKDSLKYKNELDATLFNDQRKDHLDNLQTALLLYSQKNVAGDQQYVFPTLAKYKTELVPTFIGAIPKDPKTNLDYEYKVSESFTSFTLKATLDNPPSGTTGYLCNQEECKNY